jgi:hypothetical protein
MIRCRAIRPYVCIKYNRTVGTKIKYALTPGFLFSGKIIEKYRNIAGIGKMAQYLILNQKEAMSIFTGTNNCEKYEAATQTASNKDIRLKVTFVLFRNPR